MTGKKRSSKPPRGKPAVRPELVEGRGNRSQPPLTARSLAITVLARVEATSAYLNVVLDAALDEHALKDERDKGLVTELCYGATRRRLVLDAAILQVADRKLDALEDKVLAALRLGAYQVFFTRVPKHAAVADTVQALKDLGLERAAGFTNAILRRISEMPGPPSGGGEVAQKLALTESHPEWLVRRWLRHFGEQRAAEMLAADNSAPPVVVRANSKKGTREALLTLFSESGITARPTTISPWGVVLESPAGSTSCSATTTGCSRCRTKRRSWSGSMPRCPPVRGCSTRARPRAGRPVTSRSRTPWSPSTCTPTSCG
jgi:transcription termination factor NusB